MYFYYKHGWQVCTTFISPIIHIQLGKHLQGFGYATKQSGKKIQLEKLSLTNFKGTKIEKTHSLKKRVKLMPTLNRVSSLPQKQRLSKLTATLWKKTWKFWPIICQNAIRTKIIGTESKKGMRKKDWMYSFQNAVFFFWTSIFDLSKRIVQ